MDWGGTGNGKRLAGVYLAAFAAMVIGLVLIAVQLGSEGDSPVRTVGIVLFAGSQLGLFGLSVALRDAVPVKPGGRERDRRATAWNRLALGLEVPRAWRMLRGAEGRPSGPN